MREAIERERIAEKEYRLFAGARRDPIVESLDPVYGGERRRPYRGRRRRESLLTRLLGWLLS
jgi:hypothetical protein